MVWGYVVRVEGRGEVMTVPKGAKAAGVRGSGRSSNCAGGLIMGRGIVDGWWSAVTVGEALYPWAIYECAVSLWCGSMVALISSSKQ